MNFLMQGTPELPELEAFEFFYWRSYAFWFIF